MFTPDYFCCLAAKIGVQSPEKIRFKFSFILYLFTKPAGQSINWTKHIKRSICGAILILANNKHATMKEIWLANQKLKIRI